MKITLDTLSSNGKPIPIIDTKYHKFPGNPEVSYLDWKSVYSIATYVKNCVLVYVGKSQTSSYVTKGDGVKCSML